jgi:membrane-bound metal-dependent hydrolase YbcI (DUF457 family)
MLQLRGYVIMQLRTHIAFGFLFGMFFYHFFNFDFGFVLLTGLASFLPDIDWVMQFEWKMGNRHRTFMHNIWAMIVISTLFFLFFRNLYGVFGVILGYVSHLIADSFTVTGVRWLYPYEEKMYFYGPLNMSDPSERHLENIIQSILFSVTGFLFLTKDIRINYFSLEGLIVLIFLTGMGYVLMRKFDNALIRIIRKLGF